jgi:hypothetical protein
MIVPNGARKNASLLSARSLYTLSQRSTVTSCRTPLPSRGEYSKFFRSCSSVKPPSVWRRCCWLFYHNRSHSNRYDILYRFAISHDEGVVISLWRHMQLMRRLHALRLQGLKVEKRGWLLVIEGRKPKDDLLAFARWALRAKRRGSQASYS